MIQLPPNACNSHCHVVGPRDVYPVDPNHPMVPPDSPAEALFALQRELGLARVVIVQSLAHAFDHAAAADAIAAYGDGARGVALLTPDATANDLAELSAQGFVAARVHLVSHIPGHASPERLAALGRLCADAGWHIEVHAHGPELAPVLPVLETLPCRAVIDHMAYPKPDLHDDVLRAMDLAHVFAKISCIERVNAEDLSIGQAQALKLVERFPDKLVWGNDWPHIGLGPVDDRALVAALGAYPTDALRHILVDTPTKLYFEGQG